MTLRLLGSFAVLLLFPACNVLGHVQAGPVFAASKVEAATPDAERPTSYAVGGEANAALDLDMAAGGEWLNARPQPDHAVRFGITQGGYLRGTSDGFGAGARPGVFMAGTNTDWTGRIGATTDLGLASVDGKPYGAVGLSGSLGAGFTVSKTYDANAWFLCRSLTYLTFTVIGSYQRLPDGPEKGIDVWSTGLLVGATSLSDGGAPSDAVNATTRCPH
jgi:hypothetical protein